MKIKTAEAAAVMGCSPQFVRVGMQQGKLNIGDGVVIDDNSKIIATMDGSRVEYDKENPRTEVIISEV